MYRHTIQVHMVCAQGSYTCERYQVHVCVLVSSVVAEAERVGQ